MSLNKIENPDNFRANIRKKLNKKLDDEKASLNLEKGIFNYTLKEADQRKIVKKWDNKFFIQIYLSHLRSILNNLNEKLINEVKSGAIKSHTIAVPAMVEVYAIVIGLKSFPNKSSKRDQIFRTTASDNCCETIDFIKFLK